MKADRLAERTDEEIEENHSLSFQRSLRLLSQATSLISDHPYFLPLYTFVAEQYQCLGYPDLAAGAAYKGLLLSDAVRDDADEYHEQACQALLLQAMIMPSTDQQLQVVNRVTEPGESLDRELGDDDDVRLMLAKGYLPRIYQLLITGLLSCGCYGTAFNYCSQASDMFADETNFQLMRNKIRIAVAKHLNVSPEALDSGDHLHPSSWPDQGFVRRECYPWNSHEPDRFDDLPTLNSMMYEVAPKLEVRAVELPALAVATDSNNRISKQLGVFAKEDISPGEVILDETSMLTANNKLQDALCDACSADLPELDGPAAATTVTCPECEVVFCSQVCYDHAGLEYHPAVCGMDIEAIAKDVPAKEAANSLYSLLLLRTLAMAETQQCHPLDLKEVKYIWGDFHDPPSTKHYCHSPDDDEEKEEDPTTRNGSSQALPFSFENNIRLPFHMLERMEVDIFALHAQYDVWVFNTLYAKFRGTASARLSGLGGRAVRGPEVSAVHPMWCLANHSCDPNVSWEWGGSIKFWTREQRLEWSKLVESGETQTRGRREAGIKKDEEVLNHYCDVDLPVAERREWARGALGGDCRCERCMWESSEGK